MTRLAKVRKGIGALVLLAALVGGVPYALWHFVGWPLPHELPSWAALGHALDEHGIADRTLVDALAVAVWLCWAVLVASLAAEVPAAIRDERARRIPLVGAFQPLTGHLLAVLVVATLALSPRSTRSVAASLVVSRPVVTAVLTDATTTVEPLHGPGAATPVAAGIEGASAAVRGISAGVPERTYVVQRGDTLWGIAERELGDPLRWSDIYRLNAGRPQPGGVALDNPHWIDPGWTLILPGSATASTTSAPTTPSPSAPMPTTPPPTTAPLATTAPMVPSTTVVRSALSSSEPGATHLHEERPVDAPTASVRLPSGSVVGGSFALGILGAVALARRRHRHAYRYRPPVPGRRLGPDPLSSTLRALATAVQRGAGDEQGSDDESSLEQAPLEQAPIVIAPAMADDDPEHRERPDWIEVGTRNGEPVVMSLAELAGAVVDGPGADGVLRAWVTALLLRAGPLAAEVLATAPVIERLAPGAGTLAGPGEVPGMRVVADEAALLHYLEAEAVTRTRQLEDDDASDIVAYRRTYPWDPMPSVLALLEQVPTADAERWCACCAMGARLGIGAFVLEGEDAGVRIILDAEQIVTDVRPEALAGRLEGVHCFTIGPGESLDVLMTLAQVEERPASDDGLGVSDADASDIELWPQPPLVAPGEAAVAARVPSVVDGADEPHRPIRIRVFGPYEIAINGVVVDKGLRGVARELLAWYLLRPEGASIGAAVEACWPDTDPARVNDRFWRAASDLRTHVGAIAEPATKLLVQVGDVYRLDAAVIECDLWQFQAALAMAACAVDVEEARDALREATEVYRGDLVENADYRWVEPAREDLHRRALDAHLRLAEVEEQLDAHDAAAAALERVIELDRYAEEPYRRLMMLQAGRGRPDAVAATWRQLERRLAEIDIDVEPATARLYRSLVEPSDEIKRHTRPIRLSS